jgi:hypothetical protein
LPEFKALVREQSYLLLIDLDTALAAIPKMLPEDAAARQQALDMMKRILGAAGPIAGETQMRLARIEQLFNCGDGSAGAEKIVPLAPARSESEVQSKAS